jgi:hypothetical protein
VQSRCFKEMKAMPPSAAADLSFILSHPLLYRALLRVMAMHDVANLCKRAPRAGKFSDPACSQFVYPALQGELDRWNAATVRRQQNLELNPHKAPNRRSKGAPLQWVLLGVTAALRALVKECPQSDGRKLLQRMTQGGQPHSVFDHVTAYMHARCKCKADCSFFTVSSHMALCRSKRRGRIQASAYCMVRALDMIYVTPGAGNTDAYCNFRLDAQVPFYVIYVSRLRWYSGDKIGEGATANTRFAYVRVLPPAEQVIYGHTVFRHNKAEVGIASTAYHRLVPVGLLSRPLVLDKSVKGVLTLVPFVGKGLDHEVADELPVQTEQEMFDWEAVNDDDGH